MAFTLFSLIVLLYWVITELFTILFRFTGLPDNSARPPNQPGKSTVIDANPGLRYIESVSF